MDVNISIDPGTKTTGVALWNTLTWGELCEPLETWEVSSNLNDWFDRVVSIGDMLTEHVAYFKVQRVYIELPQHREDALGKKAARRNDIVKLAIAASWYGNVCTFSQPEARVEWVPIIQWKGNLSKEQTQKRIEKKLGKLMYRIHAERDDSTGRFIDKLSSPETIQPRDDVYDAVGIGLWAKGLF